MKNLIIVFTALISVSCVEKVIEKPDNLIAKEKMADILYDIAVFEAAEATNKSLFDSKGIETMELIYTNYGIDSTNFVESDLYYASIPLVYQSIYEEVESRIETNRAAIESERQQRNDSLREQTKKRTDSIKLAKQIKKNSDTLP